MPVLRAVFMSTILILISAPARADDYLCTPTEVAVFSERIHIKCNAAYSDGGKAIWFWSVATANAQWANRVLSTATTGLVSGRKLNLSFTPGDSSGSTFNCQPKDCRKITAIGLR